MDQKLFNEAINELVTIKDILRWATSRFNEAQLYFGHGTDNAWDEALAIVLPSVHLDHQIKPNLLNAKLTLSERRHVIELIARRINQRIPAPYLVRQAWFAHMPFYVDQRVLIPRSPMAECIEEHFLPWAKPTAEIQAILDLCTGSACIAIACAHAFPNATIDAVDLDADALKVAQRNIEHYGMQDQIQWIQSDLFTAISPKQYDIIICNPPYVALDEMATLPPEYRHEPHTALAAGEDGLLLVRRILEAAGKYLSKDGILVMEVGNSMPALITAYPKMAFIWLEFSRGEGEVFVLPRAELA
jgi:ribosomal protein L3 glutamine methyltransferase